MKRILALAVVTLFLVITGCNKAVPTASPTPAVTPQPTVVATATPAPTPKPTATPVALVMEPNLREGYSATSGLLYAGDTEPVAVMVENTRAAYPQSGMSQADIVYEMYEEGTITRFMAIFGDEMPAKVGPIRRCRQYYVDVLAEFDCIITHVGGPEYPESVSIYHKFETAGIKQREDMLKGGSLIYRDSARTGTHNCYVDLQKVQDKYTYQPKARPFAFDYDKTHSYTGDTVTQIDMVYNASMNRISYRWDAAAKQYIRYLNDEAMYDMENDEEITVNNIIVQYAEHTYLHDSDGHIDIEMVGEGDFEAVIGGVKVEGTWKKADTRSPTEFMINDTEHLMLDPGVTYVQVVPINHEVTYTY